MGRPIALLLATLAACDGPEADDTGDTGDSAEPSDLPTIPDAPLLRGVHLAPGMAPGCDLDGDTGTTSDQYTACIVLFVGEGQTPIDATAFPFGASSGFLPLPITGSYEVQAIPYGVFLADPTGANLEENRVESFPVTVMPETVQTFVAYGHPGYANEGVVVVDDSVAPPASGKARLRLFHGAFAVAAAAPDVSLGATPVAADLAYATFSTGVEVDPGDDQVLLVDLTGDAVPDLVAQADLAADVSYDLFLVNVSTSIVPSGLLGFLHTPTSQTPVLVPFGPPP